MQDIFSRMESMRASSGKIGKNSTDEQLADGLQQMLNSSFMVFPNPVDTELRRRDKLYIENKTALFILKSDAGETPLRFETEVLANLKHAATITEFYMHAPGGWVETPLFDFEGFAEACAKYLPKLTYMSLEHMCCKNFDLSMPKIQTLKLIDPQPRDGIWNINMPELLELIMENHTPPSASFGECLKRSPKIERFFAHKYWHEDRLPKLYLPSCKDFTFRRGDMTERLSLYLPRVEKLNLDANYSLNSLTLLKSGHKDMKEWNLPKNESQSKFILSCTNATLGKGTIRTLEKSGRLLNEIEQTSDDYF